MLIKIIVPGSIISVQFGLEADTLSTTHFHPGELMYIEALHIAIICITLNRKVYRKLIAGLRMQKVSLYWRVLWYPCVLFAISVILELIISS
jgi:hypothetical protein